MKFHKVEICKDLVVYTTSSCGALRFAGTWTTYEPILGDGHPLYLITANFYDEMVNAHSGFEAVLAAQAVHDDRWVRLKTYALLHGIYMKLLVFPNFLSPSLHNSLHRQDL